MFHVLASSKYYAFKYRENVVEHVIPIGNVISTLHSPTRSQRGASFDFTSSGRILNDLDSS